jgi:hypothetical protein
MKNIKRGFKLASPLKLENGGEKNSAANSSTSTTSRPGQSGGIEGTIVSKSTIKRSATGEKVQTGGNLAALRAKGKNLGPNYKPSKAATAAANKREAAARAKDKEAAASKTAATSSESKETDESFVPKMEEAKKGDRIDNFTSEERRMQGREVKVSKRQEKEEGAQNTRRTAKFAKQEAKSMGMGGKEARQIKRDIKSGKTNANVTKALGGEENAKLARSEYEKSKWQGPVSKAGKKLSLENPDQAAAVSAQGGKTAGSNAYSGVSTGYEYKKEGKLDVAKEGGPKKVTEATKNLEEAKIGKSTSSNSASKETTATEKPKEETKKYDYSKNAPFLAAGNQGPESAPSKMKASALKFIMKGFGSKAGFNFNKKK